MSVQLIVFPQYFNGSNPLNSNTQEFVIDGIDFNTVNLSNSQTLLTGNIIPTAIANVSPMTVNTWYRFSGTALAVVEGSGTIVMTVATSIMQRLSNLTVGVTYQVTLDIGSNASGVNFFQFDNTIQQSSSTFTGTGLQTFSFTASSTSDIIVLSSLGATVVESISVQEAAQTSAGFSLENGQVIVDLYEDEDIPLSLSVDDFKNVAEKVQSYSKAFNLPATKRNNQIFDNIFEITRTTNGLVFNPYVKTQCILKQDGFLLFKGYLRMLDISDKSGEISYNVNLYSEAIALADVLKDKKFSDLDFTELQHNYMKTNIKNSWNDATSGGSGIIYTNSSTSGFRTTYDTIKYPFIDWQHQILVGGSSGTNATAGFPELTKLEDAFRPTIQLKYLIDRIFQDSPFTYESDFFNTTDFKKLYMDFNWGGSVIPTSPSVQYGAFWFASFPIIGTAFSNYANTSFSALELIEVAITGTTIYGILPPNYNQTTEVITATTDGESYNIQYNYTVENIDTVDRTVEFQWLHNSQVLNPSGVITLGAGDSYTYSGNLFRTLLTGDTLVAQFKSDDASGTKVRQKENGSGSTSEVYFYVSVNSITSETLLETLRGELGQWEFLKGLMTMFNLVAMPNEANPNLIKFEPYKEIFLENEDSVQLDWTDKVDVTEIKLSPLTDLNKHTIFKFVEDEDDYVFNVYKASTRTLYGSKEFDASTSANGFETVLEGTKEIIAEPFASTVPKALMSQFPDFITPAVYAKAGENEFEGFENSPRIFYNNGVVDLTSCTYYIPQQNGVTSENATKFLQFSHLTDIPTSTLGTSIDFNFSTHQTASNIGTTSLNLFNVYWLPYFNELYNADTKTMTIKVNLSPSDINTFRFYDTVIIKNRTYRVNKIDYKPNDLATVEFILIP